MSITAQDLVNFWHQAGDECWFNADPAFDALYRDRFLDIHLLPASQSPIRS